MRFKVSSLIRIEATPVIITAIEEDIKRRIFETILTFAEPPSC